MNHSINIFNQNDGVVGIVSAILIIGLVVTIFGIIQTVYVPQWMEDIEMEHMNEVATQFASMKYATDLQLFSESSHQLSINSPFILGSDKIPFLLSEQSYGILEIIPDMCTCEIQGDSTYRISLGGIQYRSRNNHYVDQQFSYETGAVIISQQQGSYILVHPFFSISIEPFLNMSFVLVNVTADAGKTVANGFSLTSVSTKYVPEEQTETTIENVTTITIETEYPQAWKQYFNNTLYKAGLLYGADEDYTISYSIEGNWVSIQFSDQQQEGIIDITVKHLSAQLSPGWIQ